MMGSFSGKAAKALGKNEGPLAEKKITGRECEFFNGFGGFVAEGREYEILLQDDNMPPAPCAIPPAIRTKKSDFLTGEFVL